MNDIKLLKSDLKKLSVQLIQKHQNTSDAID